MYCPNMNGNSLPLDARLLLNDEQHALSDFGHRGSDVLPSVQTNRRASSIDGLRNLQGVNFNNPAKTPNAIGRRKSVACIEYSKQKRNEAEDGRHCTRRRPSIATLLDMYPSANDLRVRSKSKASLASEKTIERLNIIASIEIDSDLSQDETQKYSILEANDAISDKYDGIRPTVKSGTLQDPPDGGWAWVVTFSAFIVGVILDGISFSFGILFIQLLAHFDESRSLTSWIISVLNGTYLGIGPIASILVSIFGCRKVAISGALIASIAFFTCTYSPNVQVMILLYGLLGGTGLGLMYLPAIVTVGHYFKKKRALATGIAVCGSGVGGFVFAPLSEFLIEEYTWKGAMWIISGICLNGVVVAALLRPLPESSISAAHLRTTLDKDEPLQDVGESEVGSSCGMNRCDLSSMFDFSLLKSPTFLVYGGSCFLCMFGFYIPFTFIPDHAEHADRTVNESVMLISVIGIFNTVARIVIGWIADRPWADSVLINGVALVIGGVATMIFTYFTSYAIMVTYAAVFGISIAVFVSLRSIIMAELLGIEKLTSSFGLVTMCQGLSVLLSQAPLQIGQVITEVHSFWRELLCVFLERYVFHCGEYFDGKTD